jgi:hypothetical protein
MFMKTCLVLLALIGAVCAGGAVVYLNPSLVPGAERAAEQGAAWASSQLAHATPSPAASAAAIPYTAPITLVTPPPAAASLQDWTPADCAWAESVMSLDHSLDAAEAERIARSQDTRYGTGPTLVQYYLDFAAHWQTALSQISEVCAGTGVPTAAEQAATVHAFTSAIAGHQADAASKAPHSTLGRLWDGVEGFFEVGNGWAVKWDNEWIGYYLRLTIMFTELPSV